MEREENDHSDLSPDNWLNSFEEECIEELHTEANMEEALETQRELAEQKLWLQFQNSATAIAQLYKGIYRQTFIYLAITIFEKCFNEKP
jgi:hypothetical protein